MLPRTRSAGRSTDHGSSRDANRAARRGSDPKDRAAELEEALTVERLDASNRTLRGALPFTIVAVLFLVAALGSVPWTRRLAWSALMIVVVGTSYLLSLSYERRRRSGPVLRWRRGILASIGIGVGWGALVLIALPPAEGGLRPLILVFALGISSVTLLSTAASRPRFYAVNLPMCGILTVVYVASGHQPTRLLGLAVPLYFAVMQAVHKQVHSIVMSNLRLRLELQDLAMHDELTGLYNRRTFTQLLESAIADVRETGELIGVLYLDVDRLKAVNDRFGHEAGDQTLTEVGKRMRSVLRHGDACARLGGDEFAALLRGLQDQEHLDQIAERMLSAVNQPFGIRGADVTVGASVGCVLVDDQSDAASLLSASDAAQYRAKKAGGSRAVAFDEAMRASLERETRIERDLHAALRAGEIRPFFQPVFDLRTGDPIGIEALARWVDGAGVVTPAAAFLDVARGAGMIEQLDRAVVHQAMEARVRLRSLALCDDCRLWINVDGHRVARRGSDQFRELLASTGCEPHELGVEITERDVLHDLDAAAALLHEAREAGVKIGLDDFGTGHSSLVLLRRLPLDVLKIDRSFVAGVATNESDRAIVSLIVRAGTELGLTVVAEGVETEEQLALLRELGCHAAQGFLLARPMPFDDLVALASERARAHPERSKAR
jgi:diguanylate cyclase (GGDEF)-like protein